MADATILLPNFNNERVLPFMFEKLRRNADCSRLNFLMVDDGSEDASVAVAKKELAQSPFASSEIIERSHEGIVHALNAGLSATKTELIIRIDGDATVETPGWISRLLEPLKHPEVGMIGGQVIWETGRIHSYGRTLFSEYGLYDMGCVPLEPVGKRTLDSYVFRPAENFTNGPVYEVDTLLGVCVAFRKNDALAVGGFDLCFNPVWIEDDDFGVALRKIGRRILIDPKVQLIHRPSLRGSRKPGEKAKTPSHVSKWINSGRHKLSRFRTLIMKSKVAGGGGLSMQEFFPSEPEGWRTNLLRQHYQRWEEKWGFHPLNPDLEKIFNRYYETELCWQLNPSRLFSSRAFLKKLSK